MSFTGSVGVPAVYNIVSQAILIMMKFKINLTRNNQFIFHCSCIYTHSLDNYTNCHNKEYKNTWACTNKWACTDNSFQIVLERDNQSLFDFGK